MTEEKIYNEIVELIEEREVKKFVREFKENSETLKTNWEIGRLLVNAQGGEARAKYGENLIKKWGEKLSLEYGKNYNKRNLMYYRQFYLTFQNVNTVCSQFSWSICRCLLSIKNENERNYYINQVILNNLSVRELRNEIKSKAFDRLSYADKNNIKLITENNNSITLSDMIKDPIIIKTDKDTTNLTEQKLHEILIELVENHYMELGAGFALIGHEYKCKIDNRTYKIDLLFFNYKINAFVVVEVKIKEYNPKDRGQIELYMDYVDKNIKENYHNKTEGILVVREKNKLVTKYISNNNLYITTYLLENKKQVN